MRAVSRPLMALLFAGLICGVLVVLVGASVVHGEERVLPGVRLPLGGVDLQGRTREQGLQALSALEKRLTAAPLFLHCRNRSWRLDPRTIGLRLDREAMIEAALKAGRDVPWWQRWSRQRRLRQEGLTIPLTVVFNRESFYRQLDALGREVSTPPRDAALRVRADDGIEIIPGRDGMAVDKQKAERDLLAALRAGRMPEIELSLIKVHPRVTADAVAAMGINGLLAAYSTRFDPGYTERAYNIRVAAAALDGLLVPPGQEFSFNRVVGPRSSEAGYKNAKVIVNNRLVDGPGGGVCQVSSTLYNAVLLANLQILERANHSLPVSYVPMGRDATVSYGYIDFRFRNDTESYIYLRSLVEGGQITFKIYGNTDYKTPVEITTEVTAVQQPQVIRRSDPTLKKGEQAVRQKGLRGYTVAVRRITYVDGRRQVEVLPESKYDPVDEIIAVGTALPVNEPVVPPAGPGAPAGEGEAAEGKTQQPAGKQVPDTPSTPGGGNAGQSAAADAAGIPERVYGY